MNLALERHYGKVNQGKLYFSLRNHERWFNALKSMEGQDFELSIRPVQRHATDSQYSYYRKALIRICAATEMFGGWSEDEISKFFEETFLSIVTIKSVNGKNWEHRITQSTANLSSVEMSAFIENVTNWLSMNDIHIGNPEDYFH